MNMDWSDETVINFIGDYKANNILWDTKLPDYGNKVLKEAALRTLAKKYDCDVGLIENKIRLLRESYRKEVTKVRRTGVRSPWFAFLPLSFLQNNLKNYINHHWPRATVLRLINDYHANPCLWDYKVPAYRNVAQKEAIWRTLAEKYNRDVRQVKLKLKSLRNFFRVQHAKPRPQGQKPKWFAYQALSFFLDLDDDGMQLEGDGEKKLFEQNGNIDVMESRPLSKTFRNDMSLDSEEIESDPDQPEDSKESVGHSVFYTVECFSQGTSFSESTDEIANEPEPRVNISSSNQPIKCDPSDEDSTFSEILLQHIRKIPQHKRLHFKNTVLELAQQFAHDDFGENNLLQPEVKIESELSLDAD